jgi:hypothetical protein
MEKLDLSKVDSWDMVKELNSRGYYTKLIFTPFDVESTLESLNNNRDEDDENIIVLTDEDKGDILDSCFNTDWFAERMNESMDEYILDNYDNEDYYKKKENVE